MIDLTPLEVRKKKGEFRRAMRGYEPSLVDDFLDLVADRMEELVRENMAHGERLARQDQQVAEYREREKALTEALVTAQEMREEMRRQSTREAELAKQAAEQETTHLRSSVQQEVAQLRATARAEATRLQSDAQREREREEEAMRRLRARQRQFMNKYRAFLEQELTELGVITQTLGLVAGGGAAAAAAEPASRKAAPARPAPPARGAPAASPPRGGSDTLLTLTDAALDPQIEDLPEDSEDDPDSLDAAQVGGDLDFSDDLDAGLTPLPELDDGDPFEPEPFEPEPFEPESFESGLPGPGSLDADAPVELDPGESVDADEQDGIPLLDLHEAAPDDDEADEDGLQLLDLYEETADDDEVEDDDEETSQLLRNAAAAGYRLPDEEELLLDDAIDGDVAADAGDADADDDDDDQGWLPTLLEDRS